jgi:hypothetical protein
MFNIISLLKETFELEMPKNRETQNFLQNMNERTR